MSQMIGPPKIMAGTMWAALSQWGKSLDSTVTMKNPMKLQRNIIIEAINSMFIINPTSHNHNDPVDGAGDIGTDG